jgi:hypothetical protein
MENSTKTESVMDKLTRYEFEATVYGTAIPIESEDGYWFHHYEVMTEINKLEKQNEMMLDVLKKLLHVSNNAVPIKFMEELDGVVRDCKKVVKKIEGKR